MKTGRGWGIEFESGRISNFAEPYRDELGDFEKYTDDNYSIGERIVRVRMLKESDYRKLMKNQKEQAK